MGLLKRFLNWLQEPPRTPGEQWAMDNEVYDAWEQGYADGWKGEDRQPFDADDPRHKAYYFGNADADIDIHMQR